MFDNAMVRLKIYEYKHLYIKDPVTQIFMVLNHKYDAQIMIYQYFTFQKALFIKILPYLLFHANKGR
jgi:hypothetical protein